MHHIARLSFGATPNKMFHAACSCGPSGDFGDRESANGFLVMHLTRLQGINSGEFVDETVAPLEVPPCPPGEDIAITSIPLADDASAKSPSQSASGTTESSSASSTDARTEPSTEPSNSGKQGKSVKTGTN